MWGCKNGCPATAGPGGLRREASPAGHAERLREEGIARRVVVVGRPVLVEPPLLFPLLLVLLLIRPLLSLLQVAVLTGRAPVLRRDSLGGAAKTMEHGRQGTFLHHHQSPLS